MSRYEKKLARLRLPVLVAFVAIGAFGAKPAAGGAVGYLNDTLYPGNNLICNPLVEAGGDSLSAIIMGTIPTGTTVSLWDPSQGHYTQTSAYGPSGWSVDLSIPPGEAFYLNAPSQFVCTFVGYIMNPDGSLYTGSPLRPPPPFSGPNGFYLLSSDDPTQLGPSSQVGSVFTYVLGRNPQIGEQYTWLDAAIQTYYTTTYTATGWNNGEPVMNSGQSAFFDIGPTIPGDFSRTGTINAADLDLLYANFTSKTGVYNPIYDVNGDGVVNQADVTYLLRNILHTNYADANLDGYTDFADFQTVLYHWQGHNAGWAQGDFNGDRIVDYADFQILLDYWNPSGWNTPSEIPEPSNAEPAGPGGSDFPHTAQDSRRAAIGLL